MILIELGGGRKQVADKINFNVGYNNILRVGDKVDPNLPLLSVLQNQKMIMIMLAKKYRTVLS